MVKKKLIFATASGGTLLTEDIVDPETYEIQRYNAYLEKDGELLLISTI